MNRLFISSQEAYIPHEIVGYASFEWKPDSLFQWVRLFYITIRNEEINIGSIKCKDREEAIWFVENIFIYLKDSRNLIMNYENKTVKEISEFSKIQMGEAKEVPKEIIHGTSSIQQLDVNDDPR
jgi:hypothetical protein